MNVCCYLNGKIIPLKKANISLYDLGVLRGYGVFDVMCTQNGKPFLIERHWNRLKNSADELGLKVPVSKNKYIKLVQKLLKLNGFKKSTIRTVLTGGIAMDANACLLSGRGTFYILVDKFPYLPEEVYEKGAKVITIDYQREFPNAKVVNYVFYIKNIGKKKKAKALEMIYVKNGKALEAATSNFFIVKKNKIITTRNNILLGVTRNLVIELAKKNGFVTEERNVLASELYSADEAFLAASNKDIVPVVKIDGKKIGNGKPGKITKVIMKTFQDFVKKY